MNTPLEKTKSKAMTALERVKIEKEAQGRPISGRTIYIRHAVLRQLKRHAKKDAVRHKFTPFTAKKVAEATAVTPIEAKTALRWLDQQHGAVAPIGNARRQSGRGRPEKLYIIDRRDRKQECRA